MICFFRNWPTALFIFYICLIAPAVLACEAQLNIGDVSGFVSKGTLGSDTEYVQRVYSGNRMSFSTTVFPDKAFFNKSKVIQNTASGMLKTVLAQTKNFKPSVKVLNEELLPKLDARLAFLSYIKYGNKAAVNVEASGVIQTEECWAIVRFTALAKETKEEALNQFAQLIRATRVY